MTQMNYRKMPTRGTARCYMALASLLALPYGLQPTSLLFIMLSICCLSVGVLSVPRASYVRVLLYSFAAGLVPAVIVGFLMRSPANAIAAFSFAPASALLVLTIRRRNSRSAGIFWATVALTATLVGAMLLWLWMRTGSLSLAVFKQLYSEIKIGFVDQMTALLQETPDVLFLSGIDVETAPAILFDVFVSVLPGVFLMLIWLIAWLASACVRRIFMGYVYGADRFKDWPVTVWRPLSFVYLGCFALALLPIPGDVYTIIGIVCYNIFLPLIPIFTVIGCRMLKERLMRQPGCGCMVIVLIVALTVAVPGIPLFLLSIVGAVQTIFPPKYPPVAPPPFTPPFGGNGYSDPGSDGDDPDDQGGTSQ
ncbi:MAG: hypothetical protein IJX47_02605 [Clostridia bacterium]|nr:hypothetical protein [Clostridia bacterium]MBQ8382077.1 hypothetical protein [Clostridia bacterium]